MCKYVSVNGCICGLLILDFDVHWTKHMIGPGPPKILDYV